MKTYILLFAKGTFKRLPQEIQTNQAAILWCAQEVGIKLPTRRKIDQKRLERDFKGRGGLGITCDDTTFFPHGKVMTVSTKKPHDIHARELRQKKVAIKAPRAKERRFVNSPAFVGTGAIPLATAAG
jgi:hypothetical protein